jgi:hypothetical protein
MYGYVGPSTYNIKERVVSRSKSLNDGKYRIYPWYLCPLSMNRLNDINARIFIL